MTNTERLQIIKAILIEDGGLALDDTTSRDLEIEKLRKALEFYGNEKNYEVIIAEDGLPSGSLLTTIQIDNGERAREVLKR